MFFAIPSALPRTSESQQYGIQVALQDDDIIVAAATFVPQQDNREDIPITDDDLLLRSDEDEGTEEYDRYNESPTENFCNLDID